MTGLIPIGRVTVATDETLAYEVRRTNSQAQKSVDERIAHRVPQEIAKDPSLISTAQSAVSDAVAGMNLVEVNKGIIPTGADLNQYNQLTHVGSWQLSGVVSILNRPPGFTKTGLLEVWRSGAIAVLQRATNSDGTWYRETHLNDEDWGEWRRVGQEPVVSETMLASLHEGQALYVVDPNIAATDFDVYPTGFWGYWSSGSWGKNSTELLGGRGVSYTGGGRAFLAWNHFVRATDVDVTIRAAIPAMTVNTNGGIVIRAGGGIGTEQGYTPFLAIIGGVPSLVLAKLVSGAYTRLANVPFTIADGEPYMMRVQALGTTIRVKAWLAEEPEPEGWMIGVTDSSIPDEGRIGLFQNSGALSAWDYLQVKVGDQ